ncbi:hypothetical protein ACFPRL_32155 [Pseudoclavibacter helvolus]
MMVERADRSVGTENLQCPHNRAQGPEPRPRPVRPRGGGPRDGDMRQRTLVVEGEARQVELWAQLCHTWPQR